MKEPRLKITSIINQGVGFARNLGINKALGDALCFMDPDDLYPSKDVLKNLYEKMKTENINICGGSAYLLKGKEIIKESFGDKYQFKQEAIVSFRDYQWRYRFWRFMYSREFLIKNKIIFPNYIRWQDPPFLVKAMILSEKFYAFSDASYLYRLTLARKTCPYEYIRDCLMGMHDVIDMAARKGLLELKSNTINHINTSIYFPLLYYILTGKKDLLDLLQIIKEKINYSLIVENDFNFKVEEIVNEYPKIKKEKIKLLKVSHSFKNIIIYGAGKVGRLTYKYLKSNLPDASFCYSVTTITDNSTMIDGIAVDAIEKYTNYNLDSLVIIATKENLHEEIHNNIIKYIFKCYKNIR